MKKILTLTLIGACAIANPVFAQSQNDENIKADVRALDKDNAALKKDRDTLAHDRAAKAADKANDNTGSQAADSVKIGAVKAAIGEKKAEKSVDEKILQGHKDNINNGDSNAASGN